MIGSGLATAGATLPAMGASWFGLSRRGAWRPRPIQIVSTLTPSIMSEPYHKVGLQVSCFFLMISDPIPAQPSLTVLFDGLAPPRRKACHEKSSNWTTPRSDQDTMSYVLSFVTPPKISSFVILTYCLKVNINIKQLHIGTCLPTRRKLCQELLISILDNQS